jgi:chromosome segregation ATPase
MKFTLAIALFASLPIHAATVAVSDLSAIQIDETTTAAKTAATALDGVVLTTSQEKKKSAGEVGTQVTALQATLAKLKLNLAEQEKRTVKQSSRMQLILTLRDKATKLEQEAATIQSLKEEAAARFDAAMQAAVTEMTSAIATANQLAALDAAASALDGQQADIARLNEEIKALAAQIEAIKKQIEALQAAIARLNAKLADAEKAKGWFVQVSSDRQKAAKVLAAALTHLNDAPALGMALNNDSPGAGINVSEVRDLAGIFFVFRIGGLTHCFSPKLQCGGRPYSLK